MIYTDSIFLAINSLIFCSNFLSIVHYINALIVIVFVVVLWLAIASVESMSKPNDGIKTFGPKKSKTGDVLIASTSFSEKFRIQENL